LCFLTKKSVVMEKFENDLQGLLERRQRLVSFVEKFSRSYDIERLTAEEIDLWIERLRPVRLEMRAIDDQLRRLASLKELP
jgi:hypothetical protein